jgi:DNA segregation ATPase FtsK/SpoIIIE, S-DNA-T family
MHGHEPVNPTARPVERAAGELVPFPNPRPALEEARPDASGVRDTAFDVELDEPPASGAPVPVDTVTTAPPASSGAETRQPVIPPHLRPENLKYTLTRTAERWAHIAAFHAVRSPWYLLKLLFFAGRGLGRLVGNQISWWWVRNAFELEQQAADAKELREWERIHRQIKATRQWRGIVLAAELLALLIAGPILWSELPAAWRLLGLVGLVVALGHYGRPMGRTLIGTAVVAPRFRRLNSDIVLRAYYAAGLGHPDKPDMQVTFGSAMSRDSRNTGSQVVVDLPYGKGWSDVLNAKEKIASGLDVHANQVFLTPDRSSSRRHVLFVADRDPLAVKVGHTDLLDGKPRNIWRPVRFGKDERDRLVQLSLMWVSVLIGAQPRKGKTFSARLLALYAALDPYVKLIVVDGKTSPDWIKFRMVAHRFIYGTHPNPTDADPIGNLLAALDEILAHIEKVNQTLATLPVSVCPEGKLTEELARDPRFPDLRVWLLVMEEFQVYFETEDQAVNKDVAAKLSRIQAVGPSAGVIILSCSQKPSGVGAGDVSRLFNRYRDNHAVRFALKCGNRTVSEAVLGGDAYAEGFDASTLPVGEDYLGLGYLYGMTDATPTVRTFLADHEDAEKILTAARAHRERLGTLSGLAAGEEMTRASRDVLADTLTVFDTDTALHWPTLAARLAERMPEHHADTTAETVSAQLRALGVPSVNIKRDGVVGKGAKRADISTAIKRRDTT